MRVTKRLFTSVAPAALLALAMTPSFAQSTGTQDVETVVVTGVRVNLNGLMNAAPVAKERSVITSEFLESQTSGQTVFQSLNFMPGINFTNNDPYGTSGGNIRMHGQDGNHISLTLDGMPLNDTGNYAIYTNQMLDAEVIDRISALQGATDVDSPTAAATGGVISISSDKPHDEFGAMGSVSLGENAMQRYFFRVDSGKIGPWGTTVFGAFSYQGYDKWKGSGKLKKLQGNLKIHQDLGDIGWFSIAGHWNVNRNNNYYGVYYSPDVTGYSSALQTTVEVIKDPNGKGYIANPQFSNTGSQYSADGWLRDYTDQCTYNRVRSSGQTSTTVTSPAADVKAGQTDYTMTTCGNYYRTRINPSDTGNIRFSSLWHLAPSLTLTVDANVQYVLATGGTTTNNMYENDYKLIGTSTVVGTPPTTTTPFGCIPGKGCDLNGDGDILDQVEVQSPSVTNTRRYGLTSSLIYRLTEDHTLQLAYTLDWGLHRQTGINGYINGLDGFYNPFGPVAMDGDHTIKSADGKAIRYRDRKSYAVMNQISFDWEGNWLEGVVQTSIGMRMPFFERRLNQYCYEQVNSTNAFCTTAPYKAYNATTGVYTFAGQTMKNAAGATIDTPYVGPGEATKRYSRFLPHLGITTVPFGKENQFFATYAQEIAAPRTDNLYAGGMTATGKYDIIASSQVNGQWRATQPETSSTYQLGYRFLGEDLQAALILWNSQVKNRIVSTYDYSSNTYFDHNVKGVNFSGFDFESNWKPLDDLTIYANAGYDRARVTENIYVSDTCDKASPPVCTHNYAQSLNKQLTEVPKWTLSGRVTYDITSWFNIGASTKYVSRRNMSEDNNSFVPDYYTVNLDARVDLDDLGLENSSLRFNVDNLFDKHYFGSISNYTCYTPMNGAQTTGCTTQPYANLGSPRNFSASLTVRY
jgi:iron complex outermembrane recepter protein